MVELFAKTYKFDMKLWIFGFQCFVNRFTWVKISGFRLNVTRTTEKKPETHGTKPKKPVPEPEPDVIRK